MVKSIIFLFCISAFAQGVKFKGVNLPSYSPEGKLESIIRCYTAVHLEGLVYMKNVELEMFGDSRTVMKTPRCQYMQFEKRIVSKSRIFVKSKKMDISGDGFGYDQKSKELKIHKNVLIYLNLPEGESK